MSQKYFFVEGSSSPSTDTNQKNAKKSSAMCKVCKNTFERGQLRIARLVPNPFKKNDANADRMKLWHHVDCIFETFRCARASTVKIDDPVADVEGWIDIAEQDKALITEKVTELLRNSSGAAKPKKKNKASASTTTIYPFSDQDPTLFNTFCTLCACLEAEPRYKKKSEIVSTYLSKIKRNEKSATEVLVVRMLLPKTANSDRIYNLKPVSLMKIFSKIFTTRPSIDFLKEEFKRIGDVSIVIGDAYVNEHASSSIGDSSGGSRLSMKSSISLAEMDDMLFELSGKSREKEQINITKRVLNKLRSREEVINFIRLVVGNLRIKAGAKHVLDGVGVGAYDAFCTSRNINEAVSAGHQPSSSSSATTAPRVFVPVMPMLAQSCKSSGAAVEKVGRGDGRQRLLYSEIKYDGERVQVHKKENRFAFFSRALKPVAEHKVEDVKEYVVDAFPEAESIILDAEVLVVCKKTGKPLPFGTLGKKKREEFADSANNCLFVFDVLLYNGENMLNRSLSDRRALLEKVMIEQKNRVVLSELVKIENGKEELDGMLQLVVESGLEGLMVKDIKGQYEPGKRHWLKIKKDYLNEGAMADTADLVVLGAWYGKGRKGGLLSTFLMGCLDKRTGEWKTVTKAHTGLDDATLKRLQDEMKAIMVKSGEEEGRSFKLVKSLAMKPDYIVKDPKKAPVWELTGAEFTKDVTGGGHGNWTTNHTANGISVRFPRITRERRDKNWETATSMEELEGLYEASVRSVVSNTIATATKPSEVAAETKTEPEASTSGQGEQVMTTMKRAREEGVEEGTAPLQPKRKCLK
uniref:DNA ligase n=1 Tax=Hemigrapsus takanoi nimavirus TaxID=2133792 RepID=A0A401IP16_9VIRU|nr:MAG: DNA ligase 3-like protein [Hemigrapsus takanoi nimavirus]GBG35356.1 SCV_095-like protein [Hemigrapsus takanoi nimavirus]